MSAGAIVPLITRATAPGIARAIGEPIEAGPTRASVTVVPDSVITSRPDSMSPTTPEAAAPCSVSMSLIVAGQRCIEAFTSGQPSITGRVIANRCGVPDRLRRRSCHLATGRHDGRESRSPRLVARGVRLDHRRWWRVGRDALSEDPVRCLRRAARKPGYSQPERPHRRRRRGIRRSDRPVWPGRMPAWLLVLVPPAIALLIGCSRLVLHAHVPNEVILGAAVGLAGASHSRGPWLGLGRPCGAGPWWLSPWWSC